MNRTYLLAAALGAALSACAGTAPGGRTQLTAPAPVSSLYSSLDMGFQLAVARPLDNDCKDAPCRADQRFDREVARLGAQLARDAYASDPELQQRVPAFVFVVADKSEPGTASDSLGNIAVFRGVRRSNPDERVLAFLIAREMGHVIARHHDEKSAISVILSILVQLVMPLTSLTGGAAALTGSTASVVGSRVVGAQHDADQAREADLVACELLRRQGWTERQVAAALANYVKGLGDDAWSQAMRRSLAQLRKPTDGKTVAKT